MIFPLQGRKTCHKEKQFQRGPNRLYVEAGGAGWTQSIQSWAILRKCVNDREWLDLAPQVRMLKEPARRIRFLSRAEAQRLLAELPEHLAVMAAFSLATGLRRTNVTGLQWTQVDVARRLAWIHPDQAKAGKAIAGPLNAEAMVIIRGRIGSHATHVFSLRGGADSAGQHQGLVSNAPTRRYRGLPLA